MQYTIKQLLTKDIDIDLSLDYTDCWGGNFIGPLTLTAKGKSEYESIMNIVVDVDRDHTFGCVLCDGYKSREIRNFFDEAAGWCSEERWNELFEANSLDGIEV